MEGETVCVCMWGSGTGVKKLHRRELTKAIKNKKWRAVCVNESLCKKKKKKGRWIDDLGEWIRGL